MGNNYIWGDIPSRIVREQGFLEEGQQNRRYTLTYSEGTPVVCRCYMDFADIPSRIVRELSIYAAFSRLKHLVVQFAQMYF